MLLIVSESLREGEVGQSYVMPIVKVDSSNCYTNSDDVFSNADSEVAVAGLLAPGGATFSYHVETMPTTDETGDACEGTDLVMQCVDYLDEKANAEDECEDDSGAHGDEGQMVALASGYMSGNGGGNQRGVDPSKGFEFIQVMQDGTRVIGRMQMLNDHNHDLSVQEVEVVECSTNEVEVSSMEGGEVATTSTTLQADPWGGVSTSKNVVVTTHEGTTVLVAIPATSSASSSYIVLPSGIVGSQQLLIPTTATSSAIQEVYQPIEGTSKIYQGTSQFKCIEPSIGSLLLFTYTCVCYGCVTMHVFVYVCLDVRGYHGYHGYLYVWIYVCLYTMCIVHVCMHV